MHKILSYLLICVGVLLIFFSLVCMYKVFVDRQPAAPVVQLADMQIQTAYGIMVIPAQGINVITNLVLFGLFMAFVLSAGGRLALVGVNMLKNERIHDALAALPDKAAATEEKLKTL